MKGDGLGAREGGGACPHPRARSDTCEERVRTEDWVLSHFSRVCLFETPWTVAPSPGSSVHGILQQEYWSGLPFPPLGDLPDPGIEPTSFTSPVLAGMFFITSTTREA